ncbi:retroviral-like aspartic protease family protein [Brumicola nitratireducens]|uniref:Putative peptidase A2A n=1 Tax=Glaciecola nitratireducens (strain JCM 12485 / KCTC 12276 / FR1064) TaxID=1085623 RepID=G4QHT5_GLANF|nr:retroviral-like aspartic protease family protein [Glaciecola nitratireducens]AEP30312.1 putative peptidase A2A [Glaciecola nitratireducens FR1064]
MQKLLVSILLLSLGLNAYLLFDLKTNKPELKPASMNRVTLNDQNSFSQSNEVRTNNTFSSDRSDKANNSAEDTALQQQVTEAYQAPQAMSADEIFELLQILQAKKKYDDLELLLREYLKLYPSDYKAWLIEADLIFHTEPLNTAIVFYYNLLEKNLPAEEENKINSIIEVNTSKVIQQLSADRAWDLLATFIEPLLQIAPLNRDYIMGLARAYGEQQQVVLMENALAALPYDDTRAQQLRKSIYSPSAAETDDDIRSDITDTATLSKRTVTVLGSGQQFFVRTSIGRNSQLLLLDTGASTTAISRKVFANVPESDTEFIGRFSVQTAGGGIEAPLFKLNTLTLGDININNVSVIVLPDETFTGSFEGLLGMNVLRNFDFRFDPEKQKMTLFER